MHDHDKEKQKLEEFDEWVRVHGKKNSQKQETDNFKTNNLIGTSWLTVTSILPGVPKKKWYYRSVSSRAQLMLS